MLFKRADTGQGITTDDRGQAEGIGVEAMRTLSDEIANLAGQRMSVDERNAKLSEAFARYSSELQRSVRGAVGDAAALADIMPRDVSGLAKGAFDLDVEVAAIAKAVRAGRDPGWSKAGLLKLLEARGADIRKREPALTAEQAFARAYTAPENSDLARAYREAPGTDVEPGRERDDRRGGIVHSLALERLHEIARDRRRDNPELTEAQAFAEAMKTPEGRRLYGVHRDHMFAKMADAT